MFNAAATKDDGSSSSSDATASMVTEQARFLAARSHCANMLIFNRKGLPDDIFIRAGELSAISRPVVVDISLIASAVQCPASSGLEIVPWVPVKHALALQLLPAILECCQKAPPQSVPASIIILLDASQSQGPDESSPVIEQHASAPGPIEFEFQTSEMQPSLVA